VGPGAVGAALLGLGRRCENAESRSRDKDARPGLAVVVRMSSRELWMGPSPEPIAPPGNWVF
ncbi:MAG TPA: hypothetical protein VK459_26415, partial [Polyangiaceae bacterium]|nr:hypothetical protein [Polyangiaceae bacterium]